MPVQAVDIPTPDGVMDAKLFSPEGRGPWPGVLMITDAAGIRPVYEERAEELAARGYVVLVPHLYYREGRARLPSLLTGTMQDEVFRNRILELLATLTPENLRTDATAQVAFLAAQPQVKGTGLGVVGYCIGASIAVRTMATCPQHVVAAAAYHGSSLATQKPQSPHLLADKLKGELYFGHADQDVLNDAQAIALLEKTLKAAGVRFFSETYPGAEHGFTVKGSPVFSQPAFDRHWRTLLELFDRTL
jgi:carboxymethylenebutenolidase